MKDKEKQIEEMADIIFNSKYKNDYISPLKGANELYNAGYRKLPEDSVINTPTIQSYSTHNNDLVVLSREEYEKLKMLEEGHITCEDVLEFVEKARKETAERDFNTIIKALEERKERVKAFYGIAESVGADIAIRTVKELAKQFGVEIKE
jgi:hypothetical protein